MEHIINIVHFINDFLRWVSIEHGMQIAMSSELLPHREPAVPFRRCEHGGALPEVTSFPYRDQEEEWRVGYADERDVDFVEPVQ
jgi:hypothetical protein